MVGSTATDRTPQRGRVSCYRLEPLASLGTSVAFGTSTQGTSVDDRMISKFLRLFSDGAFNHSHFPPLLGESITRIPDFFSTSLHKSVKSKATKFILIALLLSSSDAAIGHQQLCTPSSTLVANVKVCHKALEVLHIKQV
jgi:hypothetical protein